MMTYEEAATRLHIKVNSVRQRVIRKKWRTIKGNDGTVRIEIPVDEIAHLDKPKAKPEPENTPSDREQIAVLKSTIEGLTQLVDAERKITAAERQRADLHEQRAAEIAKDRDEWKARADTSSKSWWQRWK